MELFRQTNIDFLRYKWIAIGASWLLIALGLFAIFVQKGLKFGIDFAGGTQIAVRIIAYRSGLGIFRSTADLDRAPDVSAPVKAWLKANCYAGPFVLLSAENVGPQVGADLRKTALLAVVWSIGGMLAYIAIRFRSFPFGVGAVVALIHDTLITVGLLALM